MKKLSESTLFVDLALMQIPLELFPARKINYRGKLIP
jgi:hypothetical protein